MLDTWEFRAILEKGKALNPLRFKASALSLCNDNQTALFQVFKHPILLLQAFLQCYFVA